MLYSPRFKALNEASYTAPIAGSLAYLNGGFFTENSTAACRKLDRSNWPASRKWLATRDLDRHISAGSPSHGDEVYGPLHCIDAPIPCV